MNSKSLLRKTLSVVTFGAYGGDGGVPCGHCPLYIFAEHEAGGIIRTDESGKPICARCRVLNGKMGSIIKGDKYKRDAQVESAEQKIQKQADEEALAVADATQTATGTKRNG